jgi:phosphoribosyl-ATP pyrophosphohydrolase
MSDAILKQLADVIDSRKGGDAAASYVARLFALGDDAILKKIGEEATEAVLAAKGGDRERIVSETADLWFHCMVMLSHYGLRPENVLDELSKRAGTSGIEEQALRKALARGL